MSSTPRRLVAMAVVGAAVHLLGSQPAFGLPPGRSWAQVEQLKYPRIAFSAGRLEVDAVGRPKLFVVAEWDTVYSGYNDHCILTWGDTCWVNPVFARAAGVSYRLIPVLSLTDQTFLLWWGTDLTIPGYAALQWAELLPGTVTPPDTIMDTTSQSTEIAGAASAVRHWAARSQSRSGYDPTYVIRVAYSDQVGEWHEVEGRGVDEDHCTMAPLSDLSAMLIYAGQSGLRWAILDGQAWADSGTIDPRSWNPQHPRARFRPSGGLWLLWTTKAWVHVSSYRDGAWSIGDSLKCVHPEGTFVPSWCNVSHDAGERPILVWGDLGYGQTFYDVSCIAFPTESGWAPGEEVPNSVGGWNPTVTRDRNGDAWVGWWPIGGGGTFCNHTYVSATASIPSLATFKDDITVSWTLSEPAPDSYWAVLRAEWNGEYKKVARVSAGPSTQMSWMDQGVPDEGILRYRIRRESVDKRYEWLSPETIWGSPTAVFGLIVNGTQPVLDLARMELIGAAAGPVSLQLYDVQGRRVLTHEMVADGSGHDVVRFDLTAHGQLESGIYFVRATDARDRVTPAVRLVLLR